MRRVLIFFGLLLLMISCHKKETAAPSTETAEPCSTLSYGNIFIRGFHYNLNVGSPLNVMNYNSQAKFYKNVSCMEPYTGFVAVDSMKLNGSYFSMSWDSSYY